MASKDADTNSRLARPAQRTGPWGFAIIYLRWAHLFWIRSWARKRPYGPITNLIIFVIGGVSPLLEAVALAWLTGGARYVADLIRRLVDVQRVSLR